MSTWADLVKAAKAPAQVQAPVHIPAAGHKDDGKWDAWLPKRHGRGYSPLSGGFGTAMDFFLSKGYSKHQAAGIVGNLAVESGNFDPEVISGRRRGDKGKAFGVAQWHPDRQQRFRKAFGRDIFGSSLLDQLEFIHWELNNDEKKAGEKLRRARTPQEAAELFDIHYERSSGQHRQKRVQEALRLFDM